MKRIPIVLILSLLIICGFRTLAFPQDISIEKNPINMPEFALEIIIKGGILGYSVEVINTGPEEVKGNLTINISTDAMFVIFGENLSKELYIDLNPINGIETFKLQPLIGFGSASISISGFLKYGDVNYPIEEIASGYAFIIYILLDETIIKLP